MRVVITFFAFCIVLFSCANKVSSPDKYKTAYKFMQYAKDDDIKGVYSLLMDGDLKNDTERINFHINKMHEFFTKYGIPDKSKWSIEYDTLSPIIKLETLVIPIFKGYDNENSLEEATLRLDFDYTKQHLSHDFVVSYDLRVKRR